MNEYKITQEQKDFLKTLTCQRLTDSLENQELIRTFHNDINGGLARNLYQGWQQDEQGAVVYYLIKDKQGRALFYFSVRSGSLHTPGKTQRARNLFLRAKRLRKAMRTGDGPKWALEELERHKVDGVLPQEVCDQIESRYMWYKELMNTMEDYMSDDIQKKVISADRCYAGVELVHFVKNTTYEDLWYDTCMCNHTLGEVVFWEFVAQKVIDMNKLVGCEYIYLFAADMDEEERALIRFYHDKLKFHVAEDLGTVRPRYDDGCIFMCQRVEDMKKSKRAFFRDYNKPKAIAGV